MLLWYVDKIPDYKKIKIYNAIYINIFSNDTVWYLDLLMDDVLNTTNIDEVFQ